MNEKRNEVSMVGFKFWWGIGFAVGQENFPDLLQRNFSIIFPFIKFILIKRMVSDKELAQIMKDNSQ